MELLSNERTLRVVMFSKKNRHMEVLNYYTEQDLDFYKENDENDFLSIKNFFDDIVESFFIKNDEALKLIQDSNIEQFINENNLLKSLINLIDYLKIFIVEHKDILDVGYYIDYTYYDKIKVMVYDLKQSDYKNRIVDNEMIGSPNHLLEDFIFNSGYYDFNISCNDELKKLDGDFLVYLNNVKEDLLKNSFINKKEEEITIKDLEEIATDNFCEGVSGCFNIN